MSGFGSNSGVFHDGIANAWKTIEYEHHEIHGGSAYSCHYTQAVSDTNDKSIIAFKTDNSTKEIHLIMEVACTDVATAYIYEGPTVTDDTGAILTIFNRDRDSVNTSSVWDTSQNPDVQGQATYFTEVTMGNVSGGTEIFSYPVGAGEGPKSVGGATRSTSEWILKVNTQYAFVLNSDTNNDNTMWMALEWYEHTPL